MAQDCYKISNPKEGQKCNDFQHGKMVYSKEWGGWVRDEYNKTEDGSEYSTLPEPFKMDLNYIIMQYGMWIMGAALFVVVLLFMRKK